MWNGGAYWTRLEGEWTAQLDDGSTAHYVVRGREVRWSDGVRRRFGYEESHLVVKIAHEPTAVLEASSDGGEKLEWKQGGRRFVWVRLRRDAREALEAPLRALFSEHAARLGAAGGDPDPGARGDRVDWRAQGMVCRLCVVHVRPTGTSDMPPVASGPGTQPEYARILAAIRESRVKAWGGEGGGEVDEFELRGERLRAVTQHFCGQYLGSRLTFHLSVPRPYIGGTHYSPAHRHVRYCAGTADEIIGLRFTGARLAVEVRRGGDRVEGGGGGVGGRRGDGLALSGHGRGR